MKPRRARWVLVFGLIGMGYLLLFGLTWMAVLLG